MLVLASQSPRRAMLLEEYGYTFQINSPSIDEVLPKDLPVEEGIQSLALQKALAGADDWRRKGGSSHDVVLGADTLVVLDDVPLGKPKDEQEAKEMLQALSGRSHYVYTGVALVGLNGKRETGVVKTEVVFRKLLDEEIDEYVASGEPLDKAGAYAIQGKAGEFVSALNGSLTNVIGLPMEYLSERLKAWGFDRKN